ncbi:4303_t:CDS:2 [Ambispora leptoticha]|uniref:4303_t:CDS:1 n=1 Tax=Ambispora leptoticha TaxID=144679 RepID=A0A9N9BRF1_9GLOM|nr:4303_t:CDS:2 [Ambispora leptoticha]
MCKHHQRRCHQRNNRRNSKREDRHIIFKTIVKLIADAISVQSDHLNSNTVIQQSPNETETYMMEAPPSYQEAIKPYKV